MKDKLTDWVTSNFSFVEIILGPLFGIAGTILLVVFFPNLNDNEILGLMIVITIIVLAWFLFINNIGKRK